MSIQQQILDRLSTLGIAHDLVHHAPAHTIEDCAWAEGKLNAVVPKNLFLTPRNQSSFYLCIVRGGAQFRTADISKQAGSSRLSFGPEQKLLQLLRSYPGAISPMGLIFPEAGEIQVLIDEQIRTIPRLAFHPNDNSMTLAMSGADFFEVFLPATGHVPKYIAVE